MLTLLEVLNSRFDQLDVWKNSIEDRLNNLETIKVCNGPGSKVDERIAYTDQNQFYQQNGPRGRDNHDDITRKVKVEPPIFAGGTDPNLFLDWLTSMEKYFDWYDMPENRKARFARMVLIDNAKTYWLNIERNLEKMDLPPILHWAEMKLKLEEKYLSPVYKERLIEQLVTLSRFLSVTEYMNHFDELMIRCDI